MLNIKQIDDKRLMTRKRELLAMDGVRAKLRLGDWYFDIDENVADMKTLRQKIRGLISEADYTKYFADYWHIFALLLNLGAEYGNKVQRKPCKAIGDVAKIYYLSSEKAVMELTSDKDGVSRLCCTVSPSLLTYHQVKENTKVKAEGTLDFDQLHARFIFDVDELHKVNEPTALQAYIEQQQAGYACAPKDYEHKQIYPLMADVNKIAVLFNRQAAYEDFESILRNSKADLTVKPCRVPFDDMALAYRIQELAAEDAKRPICIIRDAASDAYTWYPFYSAELVNTIIRAEAPILTGLGHPSDKPACTCYADYNASTAQDLAMKLMYWKLAQMAHHYQEKNKEGGLFAAFKPSSILDFFFGNH